MTLSVGRQHVERWLRATRNVIEGRTEEILKSTADFGPDGPLASLAARLEVAPEFLFTWTQERSSCAIRFQDQWIVVVDFGHLLPLLEMTAAMQLQDPNAAIAAILSREMAERFRSAGLIEEGILFARWYREKRRDVARIYEVARGLQQCSAIIELYVGAHELAHVVFGADPVFSGEMRSAVVNIINSFVKSQTGLSANSRDPELARMSMDGLARVRAGVQAGWLTTIGNDMALQEELAAEHVARTLVFKSRVPASPLFIAISLFMIQLNIFFLNNLDVLICGYQGGDPQKIRAKEPLLRAEYASVDLVHLIPISSGVLKEDLHQRISEMGGMHKEAFRRALYEQVIPRLSLLDSMRTSRTAPVLATQAGNRQAVLDELLSG